LQEAAEDLLVCLKKGLGRGIKRRRQDLDLSMDALGSICGLSANAISKVELAQTDAKLSTIAALTAAMGGSLAFTMEWKTDPAPPGEWPNAMLKKFEGATDG
jgi:transcriptional regulator with XRE-family HTH domain